MTVAEAITKSGITPSARMLAMLRDMQEERMPFTFLMPARESLYRPYDFRYIYDQPRWVLRYTSSKRIPFSSSTQ